MLDKARRVEFFHDRVVDLLRCGDVPGARREMAEMMGTFQQQTRGLAPSRP